MTLYLPQIYYTWVNLVDFGLILDDLKALLLEVADIVASCLDGIHIQSKKY